MENESRKSIVTLKDISLRTGYTINTVSRALKGKDDIAEPTRKLITDTAKELGYIGNSLAGALRSGVTRTIAVIISDVSNPLFGIMAKEIEAELRKKNYCTFVLNTNEKYELEEQAIYLALSKKVDGIILCPTQRKKDDLDLLRAQGIPFVLMGRRFAEYPADYVIWDDVKGGYLATSHLIERGHREILFLNGPKYISSAQDRLEGYKKALSENGIDFSDKLVKEIKITSKSCTEIIKKLINDGIKFTSVFAFSDLIAWETIEALNRLGYNVPQDIAVAGFDNIQSKLHLPFPLTTVSSPKVKMAHKAVEVLLNKINEKNGTKKNNHVIDTELVVRSST